MLIPERLGVDDAESVVDVLSEAFFRYPVMRYVLGDEEPYSQRLHRLVGLFVAGRWTRGQPMLGLRGDDRRLLAAALLVPPGDHSVPWELRWLREDVWGALGAAAQQRYERFAAAVALPTGDNVWQLSMLGVRRAVQRVGFGARLLRAARRLVEGAGDTGLLCLSTEHPANVDYYRTQGFVTFAHAQVAPGLESWSLVQHIGAGGVRERPVQSGRRPVAPV